MFIALFFKVILLYITCFTTLYIIVIKLKSIDFSILTLSITLNKAVGINWFIIIISLIIINLLILFIRFSL
jgi:hypothetical protein